MGHIYKNEGSFVMALDGWKKYDRPFHFPVVLIFRFSRANHCIRLDDAEDGNDAIMDSVNLLMHMTDSRLVMTHAARILRKNLDSGLKVRLFPCLQFFPPALDSFTGVFTNCRSSQVGSGRLSLIQRRFSSSWNHLETIAFKRISSSSSTISIQRHELMQTT